MRDAKSRLLLAYAIDCRNAMRKIRFAQSRKEREAGEDEHAAAQLSALKLIRNMIAGKLKNVDAKQLEYLARYVLSNILMATLPGGDILKTNTFAQDGAKETASMSDSIQVPSGLLFRANRIIDMARNVDHAEQF